MRGGVARLVVFEDPFGPSRLDGAARVRVRVGGVGLAGQRQAGMRAQRRNVRRSAQHEPRPDLARRGQARKVKSGQALEPLEESCVWAGRERAVHP